MHAYPSGAEPSKVYLFLTFGFKLVSLPFLKLMNDFHSFVGQGWRNRVFSRAELYSYSFDFSSCFGGDSNSQFDPKTGEILHFVKGDSNIVNILNLNLPCKLSFFIYTYFLFFSSQSSPTQEFHQPTTTTFREPIILEIPVVSEVISLRGSQDAAWANVAAEVLPPIVQDPIQVENLFFYFVFVMFS